MKTMKTPLIEVKEVCKSFKVRDRQDLLVLEKVNFSIHSGEIVVILGKSGAGKSTLLRILSGLEPPSSGEVFFKGEKVTEPVDGLTMVFQNFALMPWLTVLQNVELGLEAKGIPRAQCRDLALGAIDVVGLDGFESAYPKELSGGMCQRVGFARAFVVEPDVLAMDEAFSALDVLTADNLRRDLLRLWQGKKTNIKAILAVTHNIEGAVTLADRIIILGNDPGTVKAELKVDLPRPRNTQDPGFRDVVDQVYMAVTAKKDIELPFGKHKDTEKVIELGHRLPKVDISELIGLMETIENDGQEGCMDLPLLSEQLHLEIDDLFPLTEAAEILRFGQISNGDITLTEMGRAFIAADIQKKKKLFATQLLNYVPLARLIRQTLDKRPDRLIKEERFLEEIEGSLSQDAADEVLSTVIDWGRYAEIFSYDYNTGMLSHYKEAE